MLTKASAFQISGLKVQLSKMSRDLVDLECTNGELKEEVETLEVMRSAVIDIFRKRYTDTYSNDFDISCTVLQT